MVLYCKRVIVVTGAQLRAARAFLNISVSELAERTGLAVNTIRRAESTNGAPAITVANMALLIAKYQTWGLDFIEAGGNGVGVRLASDEPLELNRRRRSNSEH